MIVMDAPIRSLFDEMDALLAIRTPLLVDSSFKIPESMAVFSPSACAKVSQSAIVSQPHSHIAPPIL